MVNLFVPEPVATPPVPVVNSPVPKDVPATTTQVMVTFAGQEETGVQVRTVLALFQLLVTLYVPKGLCEMKVAVTEVGSTTAEAKVKTTGEFTDTPVARSAGSLVICADRVSSVSMRSPANIRGEVSEAVQYRFRLLFMILAKRAKSIAIIRNLATFQARDYTSTD